MKKLIQIILPVLLLSGCIEIVEEITINPDKSGTVSFSMDLGTLGSMAMNMGEGYMQGTMLEQIKNLPETTAGLLKNLDGISNISTVTNKKGLYSVSFDFKSEKDLNNALYKLFDVKKPFFAPNYLRIKKHKIIKKNYAPALKLFMKKYRSQLKDESILKLLTYKSVINLPSEIKKYSNNKSTISSANKTVEFKCTLEELLTKDVNIGNKIRY